MAAKDRHHVIPRARCRELGVTPKFPGNIRRVTTSKHRAWHCLFGNATPEEAIEIIRRDWALSDEAQREFDRLKEQTFNEKFAQEFPFPASALKAVGTPRR